MAHNLGFAAVSGAAVRYRLYSAWGLTPLEIAKVVGFTSLTYGLGGMALGGLVLVFEPEVVPWFGTHLPHWALQAMALPLWGIVLTYVVLSRFKRHVRLFGHEIDLPEPRMALMQTGLATVDVAITAAIFYILLPQAEGLTFLRFVGIYLAAYTAGIAAHVPGGLGVFDGAVLLGLQPYMPAPEVIGALLVFRLYYYIIPLFISGTLFVGFKLGQRRNILQRVTALGRGARRWRCRRSPRSWRSPARCLSSWGRCRPRGRSSRNGPAMPRPSPPTLPPRSWGRCCWSWPMG
ncbi:hypothetical protein [Dankookia sp. P2]|uniref:hypothetical protein n=1 Tax=Dankookia sp. P2 TaxID=3423955 RepID=UPI003D664258